MAVKPGWSWVWIEMPEKSYLGHVIVDAAGLSDVVMVDPIPNKLDDECYGQFSKAKSVADAVKQFSADMMADREKYCGDALWRPPRRTLSRLWRNRRGRFIRLRRKLARKRLECD